MKKVYFLVRFYLFVAIVFSNKIFAQKGSTVIWIDKFENSTNQTLTNGKWSTVTDSAGGGASQIKKYFYKDPKRKSTSLSFTYALDKANWEWQPYVSIGCELTSQQIPEGPINGIVYEFKGSKHSLLYRTSLAKDNAFYQIEIPACEEWTTIVIPFSELSQPEWGKAVAFNERDVTGLSWQVVGRTNDSGKVAIDDVRLLGDLKSKELGKNPLLVTKNKDKKVETIFSKLLNEKREIWVYVPKEKEATSEPSRYPVVYLLDANWHFSSVVNMIKEMSADTLCPKMIVVGITNTDRFRDLSPTPFSGKTPYRAFWDSVKTGGGEIFTSFIEKELMPHIDSIYPSSPYRIFIGASLGGLLSVNTLFNHTDLFNAYVSCDGSMWWDQQRMVKLADKVLREKNFSNKALYFSVANTLPDGMDTAQALMDTSHSTYHIRSLFQFKEVLQKHPESGLQWSSHYYPNFGHDNVPEISEKDALRYFFRDYKLTRNLFDLSLNSDSIIIKHYTMLSKQMGYPIHPSESLINALGNYYLTNNRLDKAELFYKMNVKNYPRSCKSLHCLGSFYEKKGEKASAIEWYTIELQVKENKVTRKKINRLKK